LLSVATVKVEIGYGGLYQTQGRKGYLNTQDTTLALYVFIMPSIHCLLEHEQNTRLQHCWRAGQGLSLSKYTKSWIIRCIWFIQSMQCACENSPCVKWHERNITQLEAATDILKERATHREPGKILK